MPTATKKGNSTTFTPKQSEQDGKPFIAFRDEQYRSSFYKHTAELIESHVKAMNEAASRLEDRGKIKEAKALRTAAKTTFYPQVTTDPYTTPLKYMMLDSILNDGNVSRAVRTLITFTLGQQVKPKLISRIDPDEQIDQKGSTTWNGTTVKHEDLLRLVKYIENRADVDFRLRLQGVMKQAYTFGRGALGIQFGPLEFEGKTYQNIPTALRPLTSLFLGYVTIDNDTWKPQSVVYASLTSSMTNPVPMEDLIYLVHEDDNTQPRSVGYGTSLLLSSIHLSESVRYAQEVAIKEIFESLWAGLLEIKANSRVASVLSSIASSFQTGAGKSFVHNQDITVTPHKIEHDLDKMIAAMETMSQMIGRAVGVPSPLMNHESVTNRATLEEVLSAWEVSRLRNEREWLTDAIEDQWYDRILKSVFNTDDVSQCPIKLTLDYVSITFVKPEDKLPMMQQMLDTGLFTRERVLREGGYGDEVIAELEDVAQEKLDNQQKFGAPTPEMQATMNNMAFQKKMNAFADNSNSNQQQPPQPTNQGAK